MPTWTSLGARQAVKFWDPANPSNSFSPQFNPKTLARTPGTVRKYVKTANGTSIISGDREFPPSEIKITWDQLDISDYQALVPFTSISPIVFADNNNNGFLGVLVIDKAGQVAGLTKNVWAVEAAFLVIAPFNGATGTINNLLPATIGQTLSKTGGYIPANTTLYVWPTAFTAWGESLVGSPLTVATPAFIGLPAAATLGQTAGGTMPQTTYYVKYSWYSSWGESLVSLEQNFTVSANNLLTVTPPTPPAQATGWNVYVSTTSALETEQNNTGLALNSTWTEPTSGLITGSAPPQVDNSSSNTWKSTITWTQPNNTYFTKTRLYWSSANTSSNATMLSEIQAGQTGQFVLYAPYTTYNTVNPPTYTTAFTGYWAGALWQQG